MSLLPYERLQEVHDRIFINRDRGEMVLQRRPFRWMLDGKVVSNAYESFSVQQVCEDRGWAIVQRISDDLYVVARTAPDAGKEGP